MLGMSGYFGASPFTMDGKIAGYPLKGDVTLPFVMNITPQQAEMTWLLGKQGDHLTFSGSSALKLSGDGTTKDYNLSGEWDLTPVSYSYPGKIIKLAGINNYLSFKGNINEQGVNVPSITYKIGRMVSDNSVKYSFENHEIQFGIKSNKFPIEDISSVFPILRKYEPSGEIEGEIYGEGVTDSFKDDDWHGNLTFSDISFKPAFTNKRINGLTGSVNIEGNSIETSYLTASVGSTIISGKGTLHNFDNPVIDFSFFSPGVDLSDFGFVTTGTIPAISAVKGEAVYRDNDIHIKDLHGYLKESPVDVRGSVHNLDNPAFDLIINAKTLDIEDIIAFASLGRDGGNGTSPQVSLRALLKADSVVYKDFKFDKFSSKVLIDNKIVYLQGIKTYFLKGNLASDVRLDFLSPSPYYQMKFTLENSSADKFLQLLSVKQREVTGTLSMKGDLIAKGNSMDEVKRSLLGHVTFKAHDGTLKRFSVLSKIFSILNVSQLLTFQLPDMVSGGMGYSDITGTLSIKNGVISSDDFLITSNAMNISTSGNMDLGRNELDLLVGVQPLQTVDKVVSRIPIAGWVLTGGDKSFIATYFKVTGPIDNPNVNPIPVRSLAKGVFDIFKRALQLPAKLFTNPETVIFGNQ